MILVVGSTGQIGREVVQKLSAAGITLRALVRNPDRAKALALPGVEIVTGDAGKPDSLAGPLAGVDTALLVTTPSPDMAAIQIAFIDAAAKAGVKRIVKVSAIGAMANSRSLFSRLHAEVEAKLETSGLAWTILQPNFFMENLLGAAGTIAAEGKIYAPAGDGKATLIDARDIAAVAVAVLTQPGHDGATYVLTGGEPLSYADAAARIGAALGKTVTYVNLPGDAAKQGMIQSGMPEWFADDMVKLLGIYASGVAAGISPAVKQLTGAEPRTFDAFVHDHLAAFSGTQTATV